MGATVAADADDGRADEDAPPGEAALEQRARPADQRRGAHPVVSGRSAAPQARVPGLHAGVAEDVLGATEARDARVPPRSLPWSCSPA